MKSTSRECAALCNGQPATADEVLALRLAAANIHGRFMNYTFATFPQHAGVEEAFRIAREYASTAKSDPPGLLLVGPTGTGKTSLAISIGQERIRAADPSEGAWQYQVTPRIMEQYRGGTLRRRPAPVHFETWTDLKTRWRQDERRKADEGEDDGTLLDELHAWCRLLILDEIGLGEFSLWREELMLGILARVEQGRRLVLTSNREPADLIQVIGDRAADRLTDPQMFRVVAVTGPSLRQRRVRA